MPRHAERMAGDLAFVPMAAMPGVPGLSVPDDIYWILSRPAPLLGMVRPTAGTPWPALRALGVGRVACLTDDAPDYDPAPLAFECSVELQDLYGAISPSRPEEEEAKIACVVSSVVDALRRGEGVVVHCAGGTGRTGTVLGAALTALGVPVEDAILHLQAVNKLRGRSWPESPWQEALLRRFQA